MDVKKLIRSRFSQRKAQSSKGDYGRVLIVAGSRGMSGACYLASMAALRSGAGLVTVGVPKCLVTPLTRRFTEAMMLMLPETRAGSIGRRAGERILTFLKTQDVLAIGPGLSINKETQAVVRQVVSKSQRPVVIDADGLNAFKGKVQMFKRLKTAAVLTPHAGEFVRLFGGKTPKKDFDRKSRACQAAKAYRVHVVLKGHRSIVASPDGKVYVNPTGNPGMATGGSGDVLTGVISAFLGQGLEPFDAACLGTYLHGLAGDLASKKKGQVSLIAGDIVGCLPQAFRKASF